MRALDAYRGIRRELDKTGSPSFSINDFNYHFNNAVLDYIAENYAGLDLRQKEDDDLRAVLEYDKVLTGLAAGAANLPDDYRHTLGVKVRVRFLNAYEEFAKNEEVTFTEVSRLRTGARGVQNAYKEPSPRKVFFRIAGNKLTIEAGSIVEILTIWLDYVKLTSKVYLNPTNGANLTLEENNTTLPFSDDVSREIIAFCAHIFMENTNNPRTGSSLQEKRLRQE